MISSSLLTFVGGFVVKLLLGWLQQRQDNANTIALGQATATAQVNKETADADRRAAGAAINAPDVDRTITDLERGKL